MSVFKATAVRAEQSRICNGSCSCRSVAVDVEDGRFFLAKAAVAMAAVVGGVATASVAIDVEDEHFFERQLSVP
jgi:hypothetical protein